ncbi:hypothetical protein CUMW_238490 [Citrus unshiu]|uniref:Uncharacterized protein n=1 Tax=Citrus unshiu TaxID=55188 RepID=A0A2H5QKG7_CITUN|nr:hypothetical protein CUMW_238490 [Citrus unshiu]
MAIRLKIVWTLRIAPRHQSTCIRIFSNGIVTPHLSMPHHRSMPRHHSVCVNSIMNSNMDSTVHVNNVIFTFILVLRLLTVLSSKVMSVLPSELSLL